VAEGVRQRATRHGDALSIPATGRTAELPFQTRLEIRGGVIVSAELDFDVEEMKKRLAFG
jgi:hypothetical protein